MKDCHCWSSYPLHLQMVDANFCPRWGFELLIRDAAGKCSTIRAKNFCIFCTFIKEITRYLNVPFTASFQKTFGCGLKIELMKQFEALGYKTSTICSRGTFLVLYPTSCDSPEGVNLRLTDRIHR